MTVWRFGHHDEWLRWQVEQRAILNAEHVENAALRDVLTVRGIPGICAVCNAQGWFGCPRSEEGAAVSFRESLHCDTCRSNARQRSVAQVLFDSIDAAHSKIYLTEQASAFYLHLKLLSRRLRGSEFTSSWWQRLRLSVWLARQGARGWLRHEDVTRLSFFDQSFDAVVSLDVLEHVPNYRRALMEFARVLRPGGILLFTVPFYYDQPGNVVLASVGDSGAVEHFQPPEFHGDPLSGGVLCFHHFGWDLLDATRSAGFTDAEVLRVRDPENAIPEAQWILRAVR